MDAVNGFFYGGKNESIQREVASITKIMTCWVSIQLCRKFKIHIDDTFFEVSYNVRLLHIIRLNQLEAPLQDCPREIKSQWEISYMGSCCQAETMQLSLWLRIYRSGRMSNRLLKISKLWQSLGAPRNRTIRLITFWVRWIYGLNDSTWSTPIMQILMV